AAGVIIKQPADAAAVNAAAVPFGKNIACKFSLLKHFELYSITSKLILQLELACKASTDKSFEIWKGHGKT
ncbi:MAG: hypothetical protein C0507_19435, partial [Cyanobacteria bacterium PR.3.49]|nr:hypothetical protein [Cyanobacteria bacterium PR.3.49]